MHRLLDRLLRSSAAAVPTDTVADWWPRHAALVGGLDSIDAAVVGGFSADRVGFAFAGGYHAALRRLVPALDGGHLVALAATEQGGAHPSAIRAALVAEGDALVLRGNKTWITLADAADTFLVVASTARTDARNQLAVVRVSARAPGVRLTAMPKTPFVPEIAHAELALDDVRVAPGDVLPGDGYDAYLKPFRTIEDLHVHGAILGYLVAVGRRSGWPPAALETLASLVVTTCALARSDPRAPAVHVALAGLLASARRAIADLEPCWAQVAEDERARWTRDRAILSVAEKARGLRAEAAWRALAAAQPG